MILPIHSHIDYNKFKFNLKTVARHTSALVFENSIHGWQPIIIIYSQSFIIEKDTNSTENPLVGKKLGRIHSYTKS